LHKEYKFCLFVFLLFEVMEELYVFRNNSTELIRLMLLRQPVEYEYDEMERLWLFILIIHQFNAP